MVAAPVCFGLVAFGFLGMGPVTIAVDSGPVTDNAQSVYELSLIEQVPGIKQELKRDYNIDVNFERAKEMLEANDGAGNTPAVRTTPTQGRTRPPSPTRSEDPRTIRCLPPARRSLCLPTTTRTLWTAPSARRTSS